MSGRKSNVRKAGSADLPLDDTAENLGARFTSKESLLAARLIDQKEHPERYKRSNRRDMVDVATAILNNVQEAYDTDENNMTAYQRYIADTYLSNEDGDRALANDLIAFKNEQKRRATFTALATVKNETDANAVLTRK